MSSIVPPLKNLTFTLCLSVLRSSSLIPNNIESPTKAKIHFGHFTFVTLLLIWAELIDSFDLFLCDRSIWAACSSYLLGFKEEFMFFLSNFLQLCFQLFVVNCLFISVIIVLFSISDLVIFVVVIVIVIVFTVTVVDVVIVIVIVVIISIIIVIVKASLS